MLTCSCSTFECQHSSWTDNMLKEKGWLQWISVCLSSSLCGALALWLTFCCDLWWRCREKRLRNPWTCMLTHCDKHKQAIYLGTFSQDLQLTQNTGAFISSWGLEQMWLLSIISHAICNDKRKAHWLDASLHYLPSESMRQGSVPKLSSYINNASRAGIIKCICSRCMIQTIH